MSLPPRSTLLLISLFSCGFLPVFPVILFSKALLLFIECFRCMVPEYFPAPFTSWYGIWCIFYCRTYTFFLPFHPVPLEQPPIASLKNIYIFMMCEMGAVLICSTTSHILLRMNEWGLWEFRILSQCEIAYWLSQKKLFGEVVDGEEMWTRGTKWKSVVKQWVGKTSTTPLSCALPVDTV